MRIESLQVSVESLPLVKPFKTALRTVMEIENINVSVKLENGTEGVGAAAPTVAITGDSTKGIVSIIEEVISPNLIGLEIENINVLSQLIQLSCVGNTSAKAAVEIALYDAVSKRWQLPLYQYLGGKSNVLKNDMTVSVDEPEEMAKAALSLIDDGFSTLKIKLGKDWRGDVERVACIRDAVGDQVKIRIDANQGWTTKQAISIIHELEEKRVDIDLVEQPVQAHDIEGLKEIRRCVQVPIMADESLFSPRDAMRLLNEHAVDFLNIKLMKTGGIRRALQIADMAEAAGVECMIGSMMESSISVAAAAHLATAHPNITKIDLDAPLWIKNEPYEGIQFIKDQLHIADRPGLGVKRKTSFTQ
ncbi:L-Ala-D/L-Glu epimerase [Peribacillus sp. Bi96]|uniref:dipeptide epimerase n=1 Tax=unclassified Peribacillus TaxID=2675266 RepID=UPI001D4C200C|nr:dipeptide epimerase [Peribacillus sp. Bi96]CAH0159225.1 L-Ala-D/L-Glu epimerase [Peribacillus sp. Bi96]